jgi:imidazolonepropionase-like amidohydrolase
MNALQLLLISTALAGQGQPQNPPSELLAQRLPTIRTGSNCLIQGGTLYTITGPVMPDTDLLVVDGKIAKIGRNLAAPAGTTVIDARGRNVFPGFIDAHSHRAQSDTNEGSESISAETRIRDVLDPYNQNVYYYLPAGITSALGLHGSANAIGGESQVFKAKYLAKPEEIVFPGAPRIVKFALGENPKRAGERAENPRFPRTRMGVEAVFRRAFDDARAYMKLWEDYRKDPSLPEPRKDLRLEALSDILRRDMWVHCHSYRQDEMLMMVRLSQEYGFKLAAMQHAMEGYKIAPEMAKAGIPASLFAESWSYKMEVYDTIPMGTSLLIRAGVLTSVNTDTFSGVPPLHLDAAKAMRYGISESEALKQITMNAARQLGIERFVGSLEPGKHADITIWSGHPLSVYSKCQMTLIDGEVYFQRRDAFGVDGRSAVQNAVQTTRLSADIAPLPAESRMYAITGATIHPITGPAVAGGTIVLDNGKISAVGRNVAIPRGAVVVNARGMHVYPGFIDTGSTLGLAEVSAVPVLVDSSELGTFQPDLKALIAMNPESAHIPIARSFGVATSLIRPVGPTIAGQGGIANLAGWNREDMAVQQPATLHVNFPESLTPGQQASLAPEQLTTRQRAIAQQRQDLREYFEGAKRYGEARRAGASAVNTKLEAMLPYVNGERPVVFHATGAASIRAIVGFAESLNLRPIIAGGAEAWKVASLLAERKVPVLYTPPGVSNGSTTQGFGEFDPYDTQLVAPGILHRAGVRFAFQSNNSAMVFNLPQQAGYVCAFGLPREEALKALTINAAQILGIDKRLGSLEVGKDANVIVTTGDPMEITTHVQHLFVGGRPVSLKNRFTELYRKYEARLPAGR